MDEAPKILTREELGGRLVPQRERVQQQEGRTARAGQQRRAEVEQLAHGHDEPDDPLGELQMAPPKTCNSQTTRSDLCEYVNKAGT